MRRPATVRPWPRVMVIPACDPGARPLGGSGIVAASSPLQARSQEITEFEFHISPARSSSRPQTGVGISGMSRAAGARSRDRREALRARDRLGDVGDTPSRQRAPRSGRAGGDRPRVPTAPSATTPRSRRSRQPAPARSRNVPPARRRAPSGRGRSGPRCRAAPQSLEDRPLRRTEWPPAPSGSQYRSKAGGGEKVELGLVIVTCQKRPMACSAGCRGRTGRTSGGASPA